VADGGVTPTGVGEPYRCRLPAYRHWAESRPAGTTPGAEHRPGPAAVAGTHPPRRAAPPPVVVKPAAAGSPVERRSDTAPSAVVGRTAKERQTGPQYGRARYRAADPGTVRRLGIGQRRVVPAERGHHAVGSPVVHLPGGNLGHRFVIQLRQGMASGIQLA